MDDVNGNTVRLSQIPDADIDALMAQVRLRVRRASPPPEASVSGTPEAIGLDQTLPSAEAGGVHDTQAEFNAVVMQTLTALTRQLQQIERDLAAVAERPPLLSPSSVHEEGKHTVRALDVAGAVTVPYMAGVTNGAYASNGHLNGG